MAESINQRAEEDSVADGEDGDAAMRRLRVFSPVARLKAAGDRLQS